MMIKAIKRVLATLGLSPYVYYAFKYNNAFQVQKSLTDSISPVIFDVGAFDGRTIATYKKLFGDCSVFAFEPTASSFRQLKRKYQADVSVKLYGLALAEQAGTRDLYINKSALTNSLLDTSQQGIAEFPQAENVSKVLVNTNTLDNICKEAGINSVDILKIDVQGAELDVLRGARNELLNGTVKLIYLEVEFFEIYKDQPLLHEICSFLYELNFELYSLYNLSYSKSGRLLYGDAIFVLRK